MMPDKMAAYIVAGILFFPEVPVFIVKSALQSFVETIGPFPLY